MNIIHVIGNLIDLQNFDVHSQILAILKKHFSDKYSMITLKLEIL